MESIPCVISFMTIYQKIKRYYRFEYSEKSFTLRNTEYSKNESSHLVQKIYSFDPIYLAPALLSPAPGTLTLPRPGLSVRALALRSECAIMALGTHVMRFSGCFTFLPIAATFLAGEINLAEPGRLKPQNCDVKAISHAGKPAIEVLARRDADATAGSVVWLDGIEFSNGAIELELSGEPGPGSSESARGFVGIAFHADAEGRRMEIVYLRPTNGRADDQVRRNHSVQYESLPDYPWFRLRKENPEKYESYVDLVAGAWTKYRLTVEGVKARLYVHGSAQPTLVVNDLKLGSSGGRIGLWVGPGTLARFSSVNVH